MNIENILNDFADESILADSSYRKIPVNEIIDTPDARLEIEDEHNTISELADSINKNGLISPINVRKTDKGYEVVAGRRRLAAVRSLGWNAIPAVIDSNMDDRKAYILMLQENIHRKDFSQFELAHAIRKLRSDGLSDDEIAEQFGKSPSWVRMFISITDITPELAEEIKQTGRVNNATALSELANIEKNNPELAKKAVREISQNPDVPYQNIIKAAKTRRKSKKESSNEPAQNAKPKRIGKVERMVNELYSTDEQVLASLLELKEEANGQAIDPYAANTALKRRAIESLQPFYDKGNSLDWNEFKAIQSENMLDKNAPMDKRLYGLTFILGWKRDRFNFANICKILEVL